MEDSEVAALVREVAARREQVLALGRERDWYRERYDRALALLLRIERCDAWGPLVREWLCAEEALS